MEVLFLVAVCCGLLVLVAIGMSVPKLLVMIGMALSKKIPKRKNYWWPSLALGIGGTRTLKPMYRVDGERYLAALIVGVFPQN